MSVGKEITQVNGLVYLGGMANIIIIYNLVRR